jgi:hypothetical protein
MGNKMRRDLFNKAMGYLDRIEKAADDIAEAFGHPSMEQFYAGTSQDEAFSKEDSSTADKLRIEIQAMTTRATELVRERGESTDREERIRIATQREALVEYIRTLVLRL